MQIFEITQVCAKSNKITWKKRVVPPMLLISMIQKSGLNYGCGVFSTTFVFLAKIKGRIFY